VHRLAKHIRYLFLAGELWTLGWFRCQEILAQAMASTERIFRKRSRVVSGTEQSAAESYAKKGPKA
jgi:hypothetical protein